MKRILFLSIAIFLCSCVNLQRHPSSGYRYTSENTQLKEILNERQDYKQRQIASELGINTNRALKPSEEAQIQNRITLQKLERSIVSSKELEEYYKIKPLFESDQERIKYLNMTDPRRRQQWVESKGILAREENLSKEMEDIVADGDIALGMLQNTVEKSWGKPNAIEYAGNQAYGNQKWLYSKYITTEEGYKQEDRAVYFESGRVVGWEKLDP